jgi:hypothetical protein
MAIKKWEIPGSIALSCFIEGIKSGSTIEEVTKQAIAETRNLPSNKAHKDEDESEILAYIVKNKIMRNLKTKLQNRTNTTITLKSMTKKKSEDTLAEREALLAAGAEDKLSAAYKKKMKDRKDKRDKNK